MKMLSHRNPPGRRPQDTEATAMVMMAPPPHATLPRTRRVSPATRKKQARQRLTILVATIIFALASINLLLIPTPTNNNDATTLAGPGDVPVRLGTNAFSSSSTISRRKPPTNHACDGYAGIYHIEKGDIGGAAGTIFFQFVIGQLIWSEKYNFKPWVYLNNVSYVIYDPIVHGQGPGVDVQMMKGMNISYVEREDGHWRDRYPGPPEIIPESGGRLTPHHYHFDGNGVWENYFEPVSDFIPGDTSCENKPLVTMDLYQVTPGIHGFAPWAPKCWRYQYLPDYVTKPHIPLNEWLEPQRHEANKVLNKYIKFLPALQEKAKQVNPACSLHGNSCLGLHIRQSDKAAGRRQIQTDEFLPYVEAFFKAGGQYIYLATDSGAVMDHIHQKWPKHLVQKIRSMGNDVVRSSNEKAVFDIASHHRTNTEILIEILALSYCQFLIHGLSAVTETSIWMNVDLHYTSVNLEDPDHLMAEEFGRMARSVLNGANATLLDYDRRTSNWWKGDDLEQQLPMNPTNTACENNNVRGILHIQHAGIKSPAGFTFFSSILNQLYYADKHNLKPWIHLNSSESEYIYDADFHGSVGQKVVVQGMTDGLEITVSHNAINASLLYPGPPASKARATKISQTIKGNGFWNTYFDPVSDFVLGDESCIGKPIVSMDNEMVESGLRSHAPWSIKPWRNDDVPDDLWNAENLQLRSWYEPMRVKANQLIKKYYKFKHYLVKRAEEVNPTNETTKPCLALHLRNSDKGKNKYRSKFPVNKFRGYLDAFVKAGGEQIFVATDSHRQLEYIEQHYPWQIRKMIRTQGPYVVRSTSKWPIHYLESQHHRTNSEILVDILAMSQCELLLHGNSAASEAAIYLNLNLHNQSVNWEDPDKMSTDDFEILARKVLGTVDAPPVALSKNKDDPKNSVPAKVYQDPLILQGDTSNNPQCKQNAIIYLAQKRHSSYDRDSYGILMESLELIYTNYLSLENHRDNADLIIFHTGDFDAQDVDTFGSRFGSEFRNLLKLIDLSNTTYWKRPSWHEKDDPFSWYAFPLFSEGYRRMMHWFAIDIWNFFGDYAKRTGCEYEYIMRFDEDSFLHSPIKYDIFDFMKTNDYNYGFRLCSYEMQVTQRIWKLWRNTKGSPAPIRDIDLGMCGIYNNFFVAKLSFFQSQPVQRFLHFVDRQGMIYRRRLGDLMIHSMTIYSFAPPETIHRFLDFTYSHSTVDKESGCIVWGGIQAGYDDPQSDITLDAFHKSRVLEKGCIANVTMMSKLNLSPTYAHLPAELNGAVKLKTISAGRVETPDKGTLSG